MSHDLVRSDLFASHQLYIRQQKEWAEILVNFETANRYEVLDAQQATVAIVAEQGSGFWAAVKRWFLRSHRPLRIHVLDRGGQPELLFHRDFFFFFSDLFVETADGRKLGSVHRRFGILYKKYDLLDADGRAFAHVRAPLWRIWTFPLRDHAGAEVGSISKKWSGMLREVFADADTFMVDFGMKDWSLEQRAVIFAASISIDFDFFEENQGVGSMFDVGNMFD